MDWAWHCFEFGISFTEMLISCFLGAGLFDKRLKRAKDLFVLLLYALCGAGLLTIRETAAEFIPDFVPAVLVFFLYTVIVCHAKIWIAVLWSLINYFLLGIIVLSSDAILGVIWEVPLEQTYLFSDVRIFSCILIRILQVLVCEIVLWIKNCLPRRNGNIKSEIRLIIVFIISIFILTVIWRERFRPTEDTMQYMIISFSILILVFDFAVLFLNEIIIREKEAQKSLAIQNEMIQMQLRAQNEIYEIYYEIRAIRHDITGHLYAISGYLRDSDCEKADAYIQKIVASVDRLDICQSGNRMLDSLIGSKTAFARKSGIQVETEISDLSELRIADEHLVTVIGNLYDNAIDACLKIEERERRRIHIKIQLREMHLLLSFENTVKQADKKEGWITTKKDKLYHGFGLKNIERVVEMYDGYCERKQENGMFICHILMKNKV